MIFSSLHDSVVLGDFERPDGQCRQSMVIGGLEEGAEQEGEHCKLSAGAGKDPWRVQPPVKARSAVAHH